MPGRAASVVLAELSDARRASTDCDLELEQSGPHADRLTGLVSLALVSLALLGVAGVGAVAVAPGFVTGLVGPSGVHEPACLRLTGWPQQFESLEAGNVCQAVHAGGEPPNDFLTSLRWDFEGIDFDDAHGLCVPVSERRRKANAMTGNMAKVKYDHANDTSASAPTIAGVAAAMIENKIVMVASA